MIYLRIFIKSLIYINRLINEDPYGQNKADNGSEWISAEFGKIMKDNEQVFGLPYKPQSQAVERINLVIARMHMISLNKKATGKSDWPIVFPELVTNYKRTIFCFGKISRRGKRRGVG